MHQLVADVRRFNRVVTARIGALNDHYLGRSRSLGESRVLWEIGIGPTGCDVRLLRLRLGLDAGYLSRLLRALEAGGLVVVEASPDDRRVRVARLTERGAAERDTLDRRSDELAESLVASLNAGEQQRLSVAMREVARLLVATSLQIRSVDPEAPDALYCLAEYVAELNARATRPFDPTVGATVRAEEVRPPAGEFFVAYLHGDPVGCGAVKHHGDRPADIKRMWISPAARGMGLGRRMLAHLERCAADAGADTARLDTNATLSEALGLYRSTGWREIERFNDEPFADHWFEKALR